MKLILIVDDEVDLTTAYSLLFQLHGYETMTAANGREALDVIARRRPDLVLSDLMMPVMDGVELSRRLRNDEATASIPIILMSAAPERHTLSDRNFDALILKPARFQTMLEKIRALLPD
ncbi:response regulator [Noviherbaspirillum aridicola]|uniref:Response regulatory domain-containing protein n=1 Tax=Noviherbaspirillum aridicola TaxID=2849687 RepID=A0ABQ4Q567_9BURK|nr:response regulator [Noviherbaspirillum aridicola]GIZ51950.1 hypothetical protein NCCP691_19640 [Noviherbaspirillum aridicola]